MPYSFFTNVLAAHYGAAFDDGLMESTLAAAARILAIVVAFIATGLVVAWAPPFFCFGLAVAVAVWWCVWLDRHPVA
jgi:hypothetical protein